METCLALGNRMVAWYLQRMCEGMMICFSLDSMVVFGRCTSPRLDRSLPVDWQHN